MSIHDVTILDVKTQKKLKLFNLKKKNSKDHRKATMLELFQWLSLHSTNVREGSFYDAFGLSLRHGKNGDEGVGHSEQAIRHMLGLSLTTNGITSSLDIDEDGYQGEVKEVQSNSGGGLIDIKLNKNARCAWNECRTLIMQHELYESLNADLKRSIEHGELACGTMAKLPYELRTILKFHLSPLNTMKHEERIYCGTQECFLTINNADYKFAWIKPHVTMGGCIKYTLSRKYLVIRALREMKREGFVSMTFDPIPSLSSPRFVVKVNDIKFHHNAEHAHIHVKGKDYSLRNVIKFYENLFHKLLNI